MKTAHTQLVKNRIQDILDRLGVPANFRVSPLTEEYSEVTVEEFPPFYIANPEEVGEALKYLLRNLREIKGIFTSPEALTKTLKKTFTEKIEK